MKKYIVVDALARSGTTLMSSFLRAQENIGGFTGLFNEAYGLSTWPHGVAQLDFTNRSPNWKLFHENIINAPERLRLGVDHITWKEAICKEFEYQLVDCEGYDCFSYEQVDMFYEILSDFLECDNVFFRWNQGLCHFNNWVNRMDHYWLAMIRNPMSRACSSLKTHSWSFNESLVNTISYMKKLESIKHHPNLHIVYYEDLVKDPKGELSKILDNFYIEYDNIEVENLIGSDGNIMVNQTADNIANYGTHIRGELFKGFNQKAVNRYKNEMPVEWQEKYISELSKFEILSNKYEELCQ